MMFSNDSQWSDAFHERRGADTADRYRSKRATRLTFTESDRIPEALEEAIQSSHLRAARALLDWSMPVLAEFSNLSLSTVKRLEECRDRQTTRSRLKAIVALHRAGIRFILLDDGTVAVAKPKTGAHPG